MISVFNIVNKPMAYIVWKTKVVQFKGYGGMPNSVKGFAIVCINNCKDEIISPQQFSDIL